MLSIKKQNLQPILRHSLFADQFDVEMEIPKRYILNNILNEIKITDENSFYNVMEVLRFFMVKEIP